MKKAIVNSENFEMISRWLKAAVEIFFSDFDRSIIDQVFLNIQEIETSDKKQLNGIEEALSDIRNLMGKTYYDKQDFFDRKFEDKGCIAPSHIFSLVDLKKRNMLKKLPRISNDCDYLFLKSFLDKPAYQDLGVDLKTALEKYEESRVVE